MPTPDDERPTPDDEQPIAGGDDAADTSADSPEDLGADDAAPAEEPTPAEAVTPPAGPADRSAEAATVDEPPHPADAPAPSAATGRVIALVALVVAVLAGGLAFMLTSGDGDDVAVEQPLTNPSGTATPADAGAPGGAATPEGVDLDGAYRIYGEVTSVEDLQAELEGLVSEELLAAAGAPDDADPAQLQQLAQPISTIITQQVMSQAAEDQDITVTDSAVDDQVDQIVAEGFGGDRQAFEEQLAAEGLTVDIVRLQFRTALLAEQLVAGDTEPVSDEEVQTFYDQTFGEPIVSHILTDTEEAAQAAADRIEAGEEFAAVAAEVSTDTQSGAQGGRLGPLREGQFPPAFEEAAMALDVGEVSAPVQTDLGWHVIAVEDPPTFEEVEADIRGVLEEQGLNEDFAALAQRLEEEADIAVDQAYGTWGGLAQGGIVPPAAPQPDTPTLPLGDPSAAPASEPAPATEDAPATGAGG